MARIDITVSEDHAELLVEQMRNRLQSMDNTLNSFRSNNLTDTEAYARLEAERDDLEAGILSVEEQMETSDEEPGLGELFG